MSHTITGIDLGSWSVKMTVLEAGFRRTRTLSTFEERVAQDERPLFERQMEALKQGASRLPSGTTAYVALPADTLTLRVLDLPFADARKIEQVVGYEMEGQMIHELHDVVLDHAVLSARSKPAEGDVGCRALVVAARIEEVRATLAGLQAAGVEARSLYVAPVLYRPLSPAVIVEEDGEERPAGCRVVVDIGHRRTNLCFLVGDEAVFARTLVRGGEEISKALHQAANGTWTLEQAEQGKVQLGFVASRGRPAKTNVEMRMDLVVREALQPLLRDLRQTLSSFTAKDKAPIEEILLAGGGARLTGLAGFLQDELGVPVNPLITPAEPKEGPDADGIPVTPEPTEADRFALADTIARVGARGARELDLRRGEFQYRASFSIVRQRAGHLLVLAASLVACAGIYATISMRQLSAEQKVLKAQFETAAKELFGEKHTDAAGVSAALRRNQKDEMVTLPKATAYDLLDEISRKIPASDTVTIDIEDLDIRPKKTSIKGTIDSAAAVDEIVAKLKEIECFEEISKGPITEVSGGAKQFSLNIVSKCP
jgi:general secretion pathway protein L